MKEIKKVEAYHTGVVYRLCDFCVHREEEAPWRCTAYDEIPMEIIEMNVDHRVPYIDDRGVQFKLREDMEPIWYEWFLRDFFVDTWSRTEEDVRKEKERYLEIVEGILERRRVSLPTVK